MWLLYIMVGVVGAKVVRCQHDTMPLNVFGQFYERLSVREANTKLLHETVTCIATKESHLHN